MKIVIRKGFVVALLLEIIILSVTLVILIDMMTKWRFDNVLALVFSTVLVVIILWIILDSYVQVVKFKPHGVTINQGFMRYMHTKLENINGIKVVIFEQVPTRKKGTKLYGLRGMYKIPKKIPSKWILINDDKKNINLNNIYSYLVPIRKHMSIKLMFEDKIMEYLKETYPNIKIDFITVRGEDIPKLS